LLLKPVQNLYNFTSISEFGRIFCSTAAKNRAFRSNLLAAPKGFPLQSLAPRSAYREIAFGNFAPATPTVLRAMRVSIPHRLPQPR
jgi:hypothetical protein